MKKILSFVVIVIVLAGCQATPTATTATPTVILAPTVTPTVTLTPTPTPTSTSTPTQTPSPTITPMPTPVFPSSEENFREEVENNCAPPSGWEADYNLYFEGQVIDTGRIEFAQVNTGELILDMIGFECNGNCMIFVFIDSLPYCTAVLVAPELKFRFGDNQETFEFFDRSNWGKWDTPVILVYWTKDGLVVYKYEPATKPAP